MYQLVIFDWDGTLMDSAQKIANCIKAAARELDIDEPTDQQAKNIIGLGLSEAMQVLFSEQSSETVKQVTEVYRHHFLNGDVTEQGMFKGVEQGLQTLNDQGVLLAVATGKSRRGLKREFDEMNLEHHFVVSRCADETLSKPHPQMLHEILDYSAISPHNSIMIGDTTYDMEMAANAGVPALGVDYGVHKASDLRVASALEVVSSFDDVVKWLMDGRLVRAYDE